MFSRYYQSELTYLRELGKEFAAHNPAVAGAFHERGGDPDVERLLEGFAFLTARIRERIDDAVPEIVDSIASMVLPQAVSPIPACSVVEFSPRGHVPRSAHPIPAGTQVGSAPVDGTRVIFQTTADVSLLPISVQRAYLDESSAKRPEIRIECTSHSPSMGAELAEHGLRVFVKSPWPQAASLYHWLGMHLVDVVVESGGEQTRLGADAVYPAGVRPEIPMLPWPANAPDGLRLVQEYFVLAEKLLFFDLRSFELLRMPLEGSFSIVLRFETPPALPERLDPQSFRLHCAPVVNLFEVSADPIEWNTRMNEFLVRAGGIDPLHAEVYDVLEVSAGTGQGRRRMPIPPFLRFSHLSRGAGEMAYHTLRRARSPIDEAMDTYISINSPLDLPPVFEGGEILSLELRCTHRDLASELRPGDISVPLPTSPTIARFENISRVSRPSRPALGHDRLWRLVSHLALDASSLTDVATLRGILHHYAANASGDARVYDANVRRIDALRAIRCEAETMFMGGAPIRGLHSVVELDEHAFVSSGDAYVFGCILDWLFGTEVPINTFHRLELELHPSGARFSWTARTGTNPSV